MKIISYLNVSNVSNLEADSGFVFQRILLQHLARLGHEVVLVGPPGMANLPAGIQVVEVSLPDNKYGVRFGFPWEELATKLSTHVLDADVILVNQSELTMNLAVLVEVLASRRIPCVTYYHYLAVQTQNLDGSPLWDPSLDLNGIARLIWQRQVESALYSDCNIIGSKWGRALFLRLSGHEEQLKDKFAVIPPPVSDAVIVGGQDRCKPKEELVILYNHRLYDHYGSRQVFSWLEEVRAMDVPPFSVWVTDVTAKRSMMRHRLDGSVNNIKSHLTSLPFVKFKQFSTQVDYLGALQDVDIGIAPFRKGALWSMAIADVMSLGKPVVTPNMGGLPEVIADSDLLFDSKDDFIAIMVRLLRDNTHRVTKGRQANERANALKPEVIGAQFAEVLKDAVHRRAQGGTCGI